MGSFAEQRTQPAAAPTRATKRTGYTGGGVGRRPLAAAGLCRAVNNERARTRTTAAMARARGSPADRQATGERVGRRPLSTGECRAVDNCDGDGEGEGEG